MTYPWLRGPIQKHVIKMALLNQPCTITLTQDSVIITDYIEILPGDYKFRVTLLESSGVSCDIPYDLVKSVTVYERQDNK